MNLAADDPLAVAVIGAIHKGDIERLERLLRENPGLASARLSNSKAHKVESRSLLHIATDWPGHFPNGAKTVAALVKAGADVNARFAGPHTETPLHWAASSDDVEVLDALLDAGADIHASGAVIGGGTPLADAVAFGQWKAARRLVERGAETALWQAAALGLMDRIEKHFAGQKLALWTPRPPTPGQLAPDEITHAFWCACHGGQKQPAEYLLVKGANLNWIGYDGLTPLDAARRSQASALVGWLVSQGARSAK
jgi:ankyrin repeat protein